MALSKAKRYNNRQNNRDRKEAGLNYEELHDLKIVTHQLEVLCNLRIKWKQRRIERGCSTNIEHYLEALDKQAYEAGYMSLSAYKRYTEEDRELLTKYALKVGYFWNLYGNTKPTEFLIDQADRNMDFKLLCKIYAISYPEKLLTTLWLKPFFTSPVSRQATVTRQASQFTSFLSRMYDRCACGRLSDFGQYIVSGVSSIWKTILNALSKYLTGKFVMLIAAIVCGAVIAQVLGTWVSMKIFPYVYRGEKITEDVLEQAGGVNDAVERQATGGDVLRIVGNAMSTVVEPLAKFDPEQFVQKFGKLASNLNSIERLLSNVWGYLRPFLDHLYAAGNKGIPFTTEGKMAAEVNRNITILHHYLKRDLSKADANQILEIRDAVQSILTPEVKGMYPSLNLLSLNFNLEFRDLFNKSDLLMETARDRVEPVWLHLVGDPAAGKTWLIDFLVASLYTALYHKDREAAELKYTVSDPKFYPGYRDQFAFVVDDFLQKADPLERMIEAERMIHFSNSAYQPLPQADIESKGRSSFNSQLIITTSNYDMKPLSYLPLNLKLKDENALYRRFMPVFVKRDVKQTGITSYTLKSVTNRTTLGSDYTIDELIVVLLAAFKKNQKEYEMRKAMRSPEAVREVLASAARVNVGTLQEKEGELRHEFNTRPVDIREGTYMAHGGSVISTTIKLQSSKGIMELEDDDDEDNVLAKSQKKKGWAAATEAFQKIVEATKPEDVVNIELARLGEHPEQGDIDHKLLTYMGVLKMELANAEHEENPLTYCRTTRYLRDYQWHDVNWKRELNARFLQVSKLSEELFTNRWDNETLFCLRVCANVAKLESEIEKFNSFPLRYIEEHSGVMYADVLWKKYCDSDQMTTHSSLVWQAMLPTQSLTEFQEAVFKHRNEPYNSAKSTLPKYAELEATNTPQLIALVGETLIAMSINRCKMFQSQYLNYLVWKYDIRIKVFKRWGKVTAEIYYDPKPLFEKKHTLHANALHQAILRFTSVSRGTPILPKETLRLLVHKEHFSLKDTFLSYFKGFQYDVSDSEDFPKTFVPTTDDIENGRLLFKTKEMVEKEERAANYKSWATLVGTIAVVTGALIALIAIVKGLLTTHGKSPKVFTQSFDPSGKHASEKSQRRLQKRARIISTRQNVRAEGVLRQSKALDISAKVQANIELMQFIGNVTTQAYGFFCTSHSFATVSHVFTNDIVKKIEFCFGDGKKGTIILTRDQFDVKIIRERELAIVTVDPRALPSHFNLVKHLPKETPKKLLDMVFVDHQPSGHFLLRTCGEASLNSCEFNEGDKITGVYSVPLVTENGDCGLPYLTMSDRVESIRGIHIGFGGGKAYFTPLYATDFQEVVAETFELQAYLHAASDQVEIKTDKKVVIPGLKYIGNMVKKDGTDLVFYNSRNNPYQRTGLEVGSKKVPSKLVKEMDEEGNLRVPFKEGVENYAKESRNYENKGEFIHKEDFAGCGTLDLSDYEPCSYDEVINGDEFGVLGKMDPTSSSGPGLSDQGLSTDQAFPEVDGKREMGPKVAEIVALMEEHLETKDTPLPLFSTGSLKMELKQKGKEYKPRIYANAQKASYIIAKKYLGPIIAKMMRQDTDLAIGLDVHTGWKGLYYGARSKTKTKIIADDAEKWDMHMRMYPVVKQLVDYFIYCGLKSQYAKKIRQILEGGLQSYIIFGNLIYQFLGMPSGWFLTAWLNSVYNSVTTRAFFRMATGKVFDEWVFLKVLGDDNFMAVSDQLDEDEWNGQIYAQYRKEYLNLNTTSIFKDGRGVPKFMKLESETGEEDGVAMFLKRRFRVENGSVYPALELDTIKGMITWVKPDKDRSLESCTLENFSTALRELAYFPQSTYDELETKMRQHCAQRGLKMPLIDRLSLVQAYNQL